MTAPDGYRFLIQLVDEPTAKDAAERIRRMYGERTAKVCVIEAGSEKAGKKWTSSMKFTPQKSGFTVFVPEGWRV